MITLLNYEKAQGGDYVCHFSVGSTEMTYAEAEKEFKKISDSAFVVSPETMSISFALGVPGYGSTITMHYNTGVTVFYKAEEYTSDVVRGDEILDDPGAVDVDWKTILESSFESGKSELTIFPKTHDGKEYYAMTGCFAPGISDSLEITENGHYGWPVDKDPHEWTDEEWDQGPIAGVYVNVPTHSAKLEELNHIITQNGTETIGPNEGYDGFSKINITTNVPEKRLKELDLTITQNGESQIEPQEGYDGFSKINLVVNAHPAPTIGTVIGTPTQVQTGETEAGDPQYETLYCVEYDALKTIIDSSDELVFKLSDSQYTRPLMGMYISGIDSVFEIVEYLDGGGTDERTASTKLIYIIDSNKEKPKNLDYEQRMFVQDNVPSKIPYNICTYFT